MTGFTKLYSSILDSSVWDEDVYTRILWVTMLAKADQNGMVIASPARLRARANIPQAKFDQALITLAAPDPESRTPDNDGRRIKRVQGGWLVLNHKIYRNKRDPEERRVYQREWDRKNRPSGSERAKSDKSDKVRQKTTKAEAEAEAETTMPEQVGRFDVFWDRYPNKKGKAVAQKWWKRNKPTVAQLTLMLNAIAQQEVEKKSLLAAGQFCPEWKYGSTWLNKRAWEDAVSSPTQQSQIPPARKGVRIAEER